jgi:hypothetical protein
MTNIMLKYFFIFAIAMVLGLVNNCKKGSGTQPVPLLIGCFFDKSNPFFPVLKLF